MSVFGKGTPSVTSWLFVALILILVASTFRCPQDGRVRHVEATNKAKAMLAGADPNFKVASLRRCMIDVFCPVDHKLACLMGGRCVVMRADVFLNLPFWSGTTLRAV